LAEEAAPTSAAEADPTSVVVVAARASVEAARASAAVTSAAVRSAADLLSVQDETLVECADLEISRFGVP
jgi:hypothetical protein